MIDVLKLVTEETVSMVRCYHPVRFSNGSGHNYYMEIVLNIQVSNLLSCL